jgi:hypothetical protein
LKPVYSLSPLVAKLVAATCLPLLLMAGCATLPPSQPGTPAAAATGRALFAEWAHRNSQPGTVQGIAKVRLQTPARTVNGTQVILAGEPDRLRAETLSPFGTPLLVVAANGTDLAVLLPGDNLFYRGRATPQNLGRFTRLPLRLSDLVGILLSRPPMINYQQLAAFHLPDGGWRIELEAGQRRQVLRFDTDLHLLEADYLTAGELQLHLAYNDYPAAGPGLPRRIDLALPLHQTQASLIFTEMEVDGQLLPAAFTLAPPAGVTVIMLDEVAAAETDGRPAGEAPAPKAVVPGEGQ